VVELFGAKPALRRGHALTPADRFIGGGRVWDAASQAERAAVERHIADQRAAAWAESEARWNAAKAARGVT
jgi:hypothetical protein